MRLITDLSADKQNAFILSEKPYPLAEALFKHLQKHDIDVMYDSKTDKKGDSTKFTYRLYFKHRIVQHDLTNLLKSTSQTLVLTDNATLFANLKKTFTINTPKRYLHIKIALVDFDDQQTETVENIMWFFLSKETEQYIDMHRIISPEKQKLKTSIKIHMSRKRALKLGILLFACVELFFIFPLIGCGYFIYRAGVALQNNNVESTSQNVRIAEPLLATTKASYAFARPAFLFVFLSLIPENAISIEENSISFINTALDAQSNMKEFDALILKTNKSQDEANKTRVLLSQINGNIATLSDTSSNLKDLLDYPIGPVQKLQKEFDAIHGYLETLQKMTRHTDALVGGSQPKKYLLFFYNNMELRPGGGFIGSFATLEVRNYSLYDFQVYDVYDADGQLH